jgi:hypothetical protein
MHQSEAVAAAVSFQPEAHVGPSASWPAAQQRQQAGSNGGSSDGQAGSSGDWQLLVAEVGIDEDEDEVANMDSRS